MKQEEIKAKQAEILNYLANGYSQKEAFQKSGIAETTFYRWMEEREYREAVHNAQDTARINKADVRAVERSLLDIAKGFEYEEVKTEYESREVIDERTGKKEFKPVIKKQVRTKKFVTPNVEAIKFLLTNRDPDNWKNRVDTTQMGRIDTDIHIVYRGKPEDAQFPSDENQLDLTRHNADSKG